MNIKPFKSFTVIAFILLPILPAFAGGAKEPKLVVTGPSDTSRMVSVDWIGVSKPEKSRWGLYRFDMEEKTYTLVSSLDPLQTSYLDDELEPPATKYFYKIERSALNQDLVKTKPIRINREEVARQIASSSGGTGSKDLPQERAPAYPVAGKASAGTAASAKKETTAQNATFNEGIYIGIISFAGEVNDITQNHDGSPALIPLDAPGRQVLLEYLNRSYVPSKLNGTALYYADHKALANLTAMEQASRLPGNLDSVTIITFTDGTDTSSTDVDFAPLEDRDFRRRSSAVAYRNYISQQLSTRKIGGVRVNAWSIGIPGRDIQNNAEFTETLKAVASRPDNVSEFSEVSQMDERLTEIADGLNIYTPRMNLTLSTPAYPINTLVRITFDSDISAPDLSEHFVDARVSWDEGNKSYVLSNITPYGIRYTESNRLYGKRNSTGIDYSIVLNSDFHVSNVRQWYAQPGEDSFAWLQNSEFFASKTADFTHERKSAIVYLVLDSSSSLTDKVIGDIRNAIGVFINKLYNISSREIILASVNGNYKEHTPVVEHSPPKTVNTVKKEMSQYMSKDSSTKNDPPYPVHSQSAAPHSQLPVSQPPVQIWQQPSTVSQFPPQELYQKPAVQGTPRSVTRQTVQIPAGSASPVRGPIEVLSLGSVPGSYSPQGAYWVQIGSYNDAMRAQRTWRTFSNIGIGGAEIFASSVNGTTYYRVKAGPYVSKMEAERALERLKTYSPDYKDCFITNE
ncbi:MAG: SPOR domain-containing protein [Spirochaetaceae bacterium]|jgi:cell division protein FtsN|nr:SPOR domain-containing protein [Spirochaetaceae bacterium]